MAVPDTDTFSLQDVVNEINPTTDDLQDCFNDANPFLFDSNYNNDTYAPANSLKRFRNYGALDPIGLIIMYPMSLGTDNFSNITNAVAGTSLEIYEGPNNSVIVVNQPGHISSPSKTCLDLTANGYSDWYCPGNIETPYTSNVSVINSALSSISGDILLDEKLATSREAPENPATQCLYSNPVGNIGGYGFKTDIFRVRAFRRQYVADSSIYSIGDNVFGGIIVNKMNL